MKKRKVDWVSEIERDNENEGRWRGTGEWEE